MKVHDRGSKASPVAGAPEDDSGYPAMRGSSYSCCSSQSLGDETKERALWQTDKVVGCHTNGR